MQVRVQSTTYRQGRLYLALQIYGPDQSWLRFGLVSISAEDVSIDDIALFLKSVMDAHLEERDEQDEPLF